VTRRLWLLFFFASIAGYSYYYSQSHLLKLALLETCEMVEKRYYKKDELLADWQKECFSGVRSLPLRLNKEKAISWLRAHLATMPASHLDLWTPKEMSRIWEGEDLDLGIKIKEVGGHFIVFAIYPDSPASEKLKVGDEILEVDGESAQSPWQIENARGDFLVLRQNEKILVQLERRKIRFPFQPQLVSLSNKAAQLKLPSFSPVYFDDLEWQLLSEDLNQYENLIIDLRDNTGGDFVVMLKIISRFFCEPMDIGYLVRPRSQKDTSASFSEIMDGEEQVELIAKVKTVELRTFPVDLCYEGNVKVLVNAETSSTAEIFAAAMRLRIGTRIYGQYSAGAVLLAIWYPLSLGRGYSLSIPVATYKTWRDQEIEGVGIEPDVYLYYDLNEMRQGKDSWLLRVVN